ncbi:MAG: DUF2157 domain-containing protein [Proteobacteria bacterium]|nr:DUF2157 domain-containing protein [Pseudomonadota bacterium]
MRPPFYLRQLKRDLETWIDAGLVQKDSRDAILASVGAGGRTIGFAGVLAIFGVILLGGGAMSFVAANWADMAKPARLAVLFGSLWSAYGIAAWFAARRQPAFAQAFVLLGLILFGVNIWYVAQTYNIAAHYPDGTLMWGLGALAAAVVVPSRPALAFAIALGCLWTWQETTFFGENAQLHLAFLPYWGACTAVAVVMNWRPAIHLSALALIVWLSINFANVGHLLGWGPAEVLSLYITVPLLGWLLSQLAGRDSNGLALTTGHYAFFFFLAAYGLLHTTTMEGHPPSFAWLGFAVIVTAAAIGAAIVTAGRGSYAVIDALAVAFVCGTAFAYIFLVGNESSHLQVPHLACTLVVIVWSIGRGVRLEDRFVINLSIVAFGIWFLYSYFELFSGLMDQALFLSVGGVLLIALGVGLETARRRLIGGRETLSEGAAA